MIHYHGTPITPKEQLLELAGRHFCVPYPRAENVRMCHEIGQSVMLDNGAFTVWQQPEREIDWPRWADWAERWLDHNTTWCVLPDSIDGGSDENDRLLREYGTVTRGAPVWHLDETIGRLVELCTNFDRVCFGSAGAYRTIGTLRWHQRVTEAFDAIADDDGRVPWIHMLRGMDMSDGPYPFASVDSTDLGRNHNRGKPIREMADRWDAMQPPARWDRRGAQLAVETA